MKKYQTSRDRAKGLAVTLLLTGLTIGFGMTAGPTSASNELRATAERNAAGTAAGPRVEHPSPTTRSISGTPSLRKAKLWRFFMPVSRAENRSLGFARYMYFNTAPDDYTSDVYSDSYWEDYDAGLCKRLSYSKVRCFAYIAAEFNVRDEYDQIIGSDEYSCSWYTNVWHPVGKRRVLKWNTERFDCFWESEV